VSVLALAGWLCALALAVVLVRRLEGVARARHELAGPLQTASLALERARSEAPSARLTALDVELRRAARALEDLDAARAGRRLRDELAAFDLGALLVQQALAWQPAARAHGRDLRVAAPAGLLVVGDRVRLAQALGNLLANACEHGAGTITVRAVAAGATARVEICDEGGGPALPVAALLRRAGGLPRAGRGARGRGLPIVAAIAARHGGRLAEVRAGLALELPRADDR
jgi:signal transduction histidine kinase